MVMVFRDPLVITRFPLPVVATATKRPLPYVTLYQSLSAAEVLIVHVVCAVAGRTIPINSRIRMNSFFKGTLVSVKVQ